jgi:hypothetical protein
VEITPVFGRRPNCGDTEKSDAELAMADEQSIPFGAASLKEIISRVFTNRIRSLLMRPQAEGVDGWIKAKYF